MNTEHRHPEVIGWNSNASRCYVLRVSSIGYEDVLVTVKANSKQLALGTNNKLQAVIAWLDHNDIDHDSSELPSVRVQS